jgi:multidrug efflux pump subunit AcrA (membrane-fusion protein)
MTEQKVKKRGWVKNAAIIFLSVMLVLTFFSNTIMNRSLPEAAVEYVHSGTIAAKIRGSGTVSANESYEVKSEQTREVLSVPIKVGDEVEVGDTLLYFADAESEQIKSAEDELDALVLAYKKAILSAESSGDFTLDERRIEQAQAALNKAKAERDKNTVSDKELANAKSGIQQGEMNISNQEELIARLTEQLGSDSTDLQKAQDTLNTTMLIYGGHYNRLVEETDDWMTRNGVISDKEQNKERAVYMAALIERYKMRLEQDDDNAVMYSLEMQPFIESKTEEALDDTGKTQLLAKMLAAPRTVDAQFMREMIKAYEAVLPAQKAVEAAKGASELTAAKAKLSELKRKQTQLQATYDNLNEKRELWKSSDSAVTSAQNELESQIFALAEKKIQSGIENSTQALDLEAQKKQVDKKSAALAELRSGGEGAVIESAVNGIVKTVDITAGNTAESGSTIMTIEVPDRGYGISIPVTVEQSKNVKVGDAAEVTNNYWGSNVTATLVGVKSDPQNPSTGKMLHFRLEGDVESGSQLGISIGERGANYESIVPNSAIRTDNNGDFVLAVTTKNSAFSNRYIAQRVDIKVLAKDDVNSAVSGGLSYNDFVITTSTKPIESGMQVRLPD